MTTAAGLPLPELSRGRFAYTVPAGYVPGAADAALEGEVWAYTDEALCQACGTRIAFAERAGGLSVEPCDSLDMGAPGQVRPEIATNRAILLQALGAADAAEHLVCPEQVHETTIAEVHDAHESFAQAMTVAQQGCDAVLSTCADVAVLMRFADCLPLILVAPTGAFAVVHCGWRGVVAHLARKAALALAKAASCDPSDMNAYIGAYIHQECFEVGQDTADIFIDEFGSRVVRVDAQTGAMHADMGASVRLELLDAGIVSERIADIDVCTVCSNDRFFSFRAQDGICGRHAAFAVASEDTCTPLSF